MRGTYENVKHDGITRRRVLHHSLVAGAGLGVTPLLSMSRAVAQNRASGHAVILNYAYPEVWDPHLAGTLAANAAISPMYNQMVEDPYITVNWKPWVYLASNKVRTDAGPFGVPGSIQTILKNEHIWLEKA